MNVLAARPWRLDERLREVLLDAASFMRDLDARIESIANARSQPAQLLAMLLEASPRLRVAGRLEEARRTASAAIALAQLLEDRRSLFAGQLALAQVLQREGRHEISTPLFDQLVAAARSMPMHEAELDEALFEAGRNLFDQGHRAQAARLFREAQALRRRSGTGEGLEDCAEALRRCAA